MPSSLPLCHPLFWRSTTSRLMTCSAGHCHHSVPTFWHSINLNVSQAWWCKENVSVQQEVSRDSTIKDLYWCFSLRWSHQGLSYWLSVLKRHHLLLLMVLFLPLHPSKCIYGPLHLHWFFLVSASVPLCNTKSFDKISFLSTIPLTAALPRNTLLTNNAARLHDSHQC